MDSEDPYDNKAAYKRWAAVLDEEKKPLTEAELMSQSLTYQTAYRQAMIDDPLESHRREMKERYRL